MDTISVAVRRGRVIEAQHRIHAVAVQDGRVVESAGDASLVTFMRSSSKPIQALPLARARDDLSGRDLAIASASHAATDEQIAAVQALLAKAPAGEDELECGLQECRPQERIFHNCSGKHAGMLALCRARGWEAKGYRLPEHPVQRGCRAEHAAASDMAEEDLPTATDGCGVVTFGLSLERIAVAWSRLEQLEAGARVAAAMRAHPELIGQAGGPDVRLMQLREGWAAKGGAEGLLCAAGPGGLGVALKTEDGAYRALGPALSIFLARLGIEVPELEEEPVLNSRGDHVGTVAAL
jgi:L-asparaginase II